MNDQSSLLLIVMRSILAPVVTPKNGTALAGASLLSALGYPLLALSLRTPASAPLPATPMTSLDESS